MNRPVGVTILSVLAIIGGVLNVLLALPFIGVSSLALPAVVGDLGAVGGGVALTSGLLLLLFGLVQIAFGIGAWQLRSWAWTLGVGIYGLNLVLSIVQMFTIGITGGVVISALIALAVLAYLSTHEVRTAFGHEHGFTYDAGHRMGHA